MSRLESVVGALASTLAVRDIPATPEAFAAFLDGAGLDPADRRAIEAQVATLRRRMGVPIVPGEHAHLDALARQLDEYFAGTRREFSLKLHAPGTPRQQHAHGDRDPEDAAHERGRRPEVHPI